MKTFYVVQNSIELQLAKTVHDTYELGETSRVQQKNVHQNNNGKQRCVRESVRTVSRSKVSENTAAVNNNKLRFYCTARPFGHKKEESGSNVSSARTMRVLLCAHETITLGRDREEWNPRPYKMARPTGD